MLIVIGIGLLIALFLIVAWQLYYVHRDHTLRAASNPTDLKFKDFKRQYELLAWEPEAGHWTLDLHARYAPGGNMMLNHLVMLSGDFHLMGFFTWILVVLYLYHTDRKEKQYDHDPAFV